MARGNPSHARDSGLVSAPMFLSVPYENNSDHPHPSYSQKICPQIRHTRGGPWHKSRSQSRDFYRKYGIRTQLLWHTNPPPFMQYEPFLSGVGFGNSKLFGAISFCRGATLRFFICGPRVGARGLEPSQGHPGKWDLFRKRAEYCFGSTVSEKRTH